MKKTKLGSIAVIFGGLLLSLELYGLKFFLLVERISGVAWRESPLDYLQEPNVILAMIITCSIIIYGVVVIIIDKLSEDHNFK